MSAANDIGTIISRLYDSEINCGLSSFWDSGWVVWIGDDLNGRKAEEHFFPEQFHEIAGWLHQEAVHAYPQSDYALASARALS